ncbi:hypothetical protein [Prosthecomicrobium sp. N25]|uniref:hypothetical protein n=1 Tax=Prosthecomicrobium sp. N25 TaxID=3129254 RepID=UPI0030784673
MRQFYLTSLFTVLGTVAALAQEGPPSPPVVTVPGPIAGVGLPLAALALGVIAWRRMHRRS